MKSKLLNTPFEMGLRVLLLLNSSPIEFLTSEQILSFDFVSCYGKEFDISSSNLHGDGQYKFSELSLRNELLKEALKWLVLQNYISVDVHCGFRFGITDLGSDFISSIDDTYSCSYSETAELAFKKYNKESAFDLNKIILQKSKDDIHKGDE